MRMLAGKFLFTMADQASTVTLVYARISLRVGMTLWAMSFRALSITRYTAQLIHLIGDCFQMARADAMASATKVIPLERMRRFTNEECMSRGSFAVLATEDTVALWGATAQPKPARPELKAMARRRAMFINLGPEGGNTLFVGILSGHLEPPIPGVIGQAVLSGPAL